MDVPHVWGNNSETKAQIRNPKYVVLLHGLLYAIVFLETSKPTTEISYHIIYTKTREMPDVALVNISNR